MYAYMGHDTGKGIFEQNFDIIFREGNLSKVEYFLFD